MILILFQSMLYCQYYPSHLPKTHGFSIGAAVEQITGTVQKAEIRQAHENPRWFGAVCLFGRFWVLEFEGTLGGAFWSPRFLTVFGNQASKDVMLEMISHTPSRSSRDLPGISIIQKVKVMKFAEVMCKTF